MTNDSDDLTLTDVSVYPSFSSIGPYRLVQMLGVGGMGEVWRAERTAPFHRTVALKLIKVGMDTRSVGPLRVSLVTRQWQSPVGTSTRQRMPYSQPFRAWVGTILGTVKIWRFRPQL